MFYGVFGMITLVEGVLGSGKTYFVVSSILKKFYVWNKETVLYEPTKDREFKLYTNIDGFILGEDLNLVAERYGGIDKFFTLPVQEKLRLQFCLSIRDQHNPFFHRILGIANFNYLKRPDGKSFFSQGFSNIVDI